MLYRSQWKSNRASRIIYFLVFKFNHQEYETRVDLNVSLDFLELLLFLLDSIITSEKFILMIIECKRLVSIDS